MRVCVIGGSIAGSHVAKLFALDGDEVDIFDKEEFPRKKICGGYVPANAAAYIPINIWRHANPIYAAEFVGKNNTSAYYESEHPIGYGVDRYELDKVLLDAAVAAGARFRVKNIIDYVELEQMMHDYDIVIGADGVNSICKKYINGDLLPPNAIAVSMIVPAEIKHLLINMFYDNAMGYGWAIPINNGMANIGFGIKRYTYGYTAISIKSYLKSFVADLCEKGIVKEHDITKMSAAPIPMNGVVNSYIRKNLYLIGDAASVATPMTGGGITPALMSADLLYKCIKAGNLNAKYLEHIKKLVNSELRLRNIFEKLCVHKHSDVFIGALNSSPEKLKNEYIRAFAETGFKMDMLKPLSSFNVQMMKQIGKNWRRMKP